jgi:hypothetical protein
MACENRLETSSLLRSSAYETIWMMLPIVRARLAPSRHMHDELLGQEEQHSPVVCAASTKILFNNIIDLFLSIFGATSGSNGTLLRRRTTREEVKSRQVANDNPKRDRIKLHLDGADDLMGKLSK